MNRIRYLRKKEGLSQLDLSKEFKVSDSTLSYWESGKVDPGIDNIKIIAKRFNVSLDYLLCVSDDPTPPKRTSSLPASCLIKNDVNGILSQNHNLSGLSEEGRRQVENFARFVAEQERKDAKTSESGDKCE